MSQDIQTAEPTAGILIQNIYNGQGRIGLALGGWTFTFTLLDITNPFKIEEPVYHGQLTLVNGSTGASIVVPHLTGGYFHLSREFYALGFSGAGQKSLHGGPKSAENVLGVLLVDRATGHATGDIAFDDAGHAATATVTYRRITG